MLTLRNTRGGSDASDGDGLGTISFIGNDDGTPSEQTYAQIIATSPDVSNSAEEGQLEFKVASHDGELQPGLIIDSGNVEDEVDVVLGNGSSSTTRLVGKLTHNSILTIESGSTTSFNPGNQQVTITTDSTDGLTGPKLLIQSNSDQVNGPEIQLQSSMSSNAFVASDNDRIGNILMSGFNDAGNLFTGAHDYAQIIGTIADATAGQEAGDLKLKVASYDGVLTDGLQLLGDTDADGEVDVTIASGTASTTTVSGNLQVTTAIELGHASDTTIARSAAGTVQIEGSTVVTAANYASHVLQTIQVDFPKYLGIYVLYMNTQNYWYNPIMYSTSFLGNVTPNGSSISATYQARGATYIAPSTCVVSKVSLVFQQVSSYLSGDINLEFVLVKWTPQDLSLIHISEPTRPY